MHRWRIVCINKCSVTDFLQYTSKVLGLMYKASGSHAGGQGSNPLRER